MGSLLGVLLHAIGGFASGSFYIPFRKVQRWNWESAWIIGGVASWILAPWIFGWITVRGLVSSIIDADGSTLWWTYFFGVLWGIGGLTFGLSLRYLGNSLGMAVARGYTAAFGTLIPPIYEGAFLQLFQTTGGLLSIGGVLVCLIGIAVCGWAGFRKEAEVPDEEKKKAIAEFSLKKGILVATFSGILSACFAFGLAAGKPIAENTLRYGTDNLWQNNAILPVILIGGFTTNFFWCMYLNSKNKSFSDYTDRTTPLRRNYLWAMLAGTTWYFQFFFYGMGSTFIGESLEFASWTLHMSFIILFSTLWGLYFKEWKGIGAKTKWVLVCGLLLIVLSTGLIGWGSAWQ